MVVVLLAGIAVGAAAQTPPGYVRDGKVWFKVVEARSGEPFDDFRWTAGDDGCFRLVPGTGVRYDSFEKGTGGAGTFTLAACSPPAGGAGTARPEPLVTTGDLRSMLALQPGTTAEIRLPQAAESWVTFEVTAEEVASDSHLLEMFFGARYESLDRQPEATLTSETFTFKRNGLTLGQDPGDTTASEMNELFDMTYEEDSAGFEFHFGKRIGPGFTVIRGAVVFTDAMLLYDVPQPAPGIRRTEWDGRGNAFEIGLDEYLPLGDFYLELGGRYGALLETEVTRSPGLGASGGRITEDRGDLMRTTWSAHAVIGREWGDRLAVWAGAEAGWQTIRLTGTATAAFDQPSGLFEQTVEFTNEFESNAVRAFGGVDVRVAGPIYARASYVGSSSGSTLSVGLGAGKRRR
jgi:hypothetical protein